ncbi:MAG TPA: folate-binding protein [Rhodanobacteraceae bacterium]|nr:folate-binding protein [Rhodanobacteraceae bacterium]HET8553725.1 folate-binding protein [Rhodanobacteraceae bacterium]
MLPLRAETLSIHGPDAVAFAHAQLASNVRELPVGAWQWSAWLSPQGRVRALLQLARTDEQHLLLLLRGGTASDMATGLQRYVLRSHVSIVAHEPRRLLDAEPIPEHDLQLDADDLVLGMGHHAMRITTADGQPQHWRWIAVEAGQPWLPAEALDSLLAPALSLRQLGAVSLDKGCYPGQEIVARLHYRGGCKQHLWRVQSAAPLAPGSPLACHGETVGLVLDAVLDASDTFQGLAVLRDTHTQNEVTVGNAEAFTKVNVIKKL